MILRYKYTRIWHKNCFSNTIKNNILFIFCISFLLTKGYSQSLAYNSDTLTQNKIYNYYDSKDKNYFLVVKFSGKIDSLLKYIAVAHETSAPYFDKEREEYVWMVDTPFWFYTTYYYVVLKCKEINNINIIEISLYYPNKYPFDKKTHSLSTSFFADSFYQKIINENIY